MLIVHVFVHVRKEFIEAFRQATIENARNSVQEKGIARFDVVQQMDDPARFVLVEAYRTPDAAIAHKETAHYATWRDAVAGMMAEPRTSVKYSEVFPAVPDGNRVPSTFEFATATRILFGPGTASEVPPAARSFRGVRFFL